MKVVDGECVVEEIDNLKIPNTIRAVLVSKMDQLSSSEQITLKVASVIGAVFELDLLCDIYPSGASKLQIADDTASLLRENMVIAVDPKYRARARSLFQKAPSFHGQNIQVDGEYVEEARNSVGALLEMTFCFTSEALRELAYEQLTFSIRRTLHCKIAEWFEVCTLPCSLVVSLEQPYSHPPPPPPPQTHTHFSSTHTLTRLRSNCTPKQSPGTGRVGARGERPRLTIFSLLSSTLQRATLVTC